MASRLRKTPIWMTGAVTRWILLVLLMWSSSLWMHCGAVFTFSHTLGNNMVLQRRIEGKTGYARVSGRRIARDVSGVVSVTSSGGASFTAQIVTEQVGNTYYWYADLIHDEVIGDVYTISVETNGFVDMFTGIVYGDVYFFTGQSNMQMRITGTWGEHNLRRQINSQEWNDRIRLINADTRVFAETDTFYFSNDDYFLNSGWQTATEIISNMETTDLCAIPVYTAYHLSKLMEENGETVVPIGVICAARGEQPSDEWMADRSSQCSPYTTFTKYPRSRMFRTWVHTFGLTTISGIMYYQGEFDYSKRNEGDPSDASGYYPCGIRQIINDIRGYWSSNSNTLGDVPFLIVQLPPVGKNDNGDPHFLPRFRMAQMTGETLPNVYTIPTYDIGDPYEGDVCQISECGRPFSCEDEIDGPWCNTQVTKKVPNPEIHIRNKRRLGYRAAHILYGHYFDSSGIYPPKVNWAIAEYGKNRLKIEFDMGSNSFAPVASPKVISPADLQICTVSESVCSCPVWEPSNGRRWTCFDGRAERQSQDPWTTVPSGSFTSSGNSLYIKMNLAKLLRESNTQVYAVRYASLANPCCDVEKHTDLFSDIACPPQNCRAYTTVGSLPPLPFLVSLDPDLHVALIDTNFQPYLSPKVSTLPDGLRTKLVAQTPSSAFNRTYSSDLKCQGKTFRLGDSEALLFGKLTCPSSSSSGVEPVLQVTRYVASNDQDCVQACYEYNLDAPQRKCQAYNKIYRSSSPSQNERFACELLPCGIRDAGVQISSVSSSLEGFGWLDPDLTPDCTQDQEASDIGYTVEYGRTCQGEQALETIPRVRSPSECSDICDEVEDCSVFVIDADLECALYRVDCIKDPIAVSNQVEHTFRFISDTLPTPGPTPSPTYAPTKFPTKLQTSAPTIGPTLSPSFAPTKNPSTSPSPAPTFDPTMRPTSHPTTPIPSESPSRSPSKTPTRAPTTNPTASPTTALPSQSPSRSPTTFEETLAPTKTPTNSPTGGPTLDPTVSPSNTPTIGPVFSPTFIPTGFPTTSPTTSAPTTSPTTRPPTHSPTNFPTFAPTVSPTKLPTISPTKKPSKAPSYSPTPRPTTTPSASPSRGPTGSPSSAPSLSPSLSPTRLPTDSPVTESPTQSPTNSPSHTPTLPTKTPTKLPSRSPTMRPSRMPSRNPTARPTLRMPTSSPTITRTESPSSSPSSSPTKPFVTITSGSSSEPLTAGAVSAIVVIVLLLAFGIPLVVWKLVKHSRQKREM